MDNELREIPGAKTPWPELNKLLEPIERFEWSSGDDSGFLIAPKEKSRLAAAIFYCWEHGIPIHHSDDREGSCSSVSVSTRHLKEMRDTPDTIEVGAGTTIKELKRYLEPLEKEISLTTPPWKDDQPLIQSIRSNDILNRQWVTIDGALVKGVEGIPILTAQPEGFITSITLKLWPKSPRRAVWSWMAPPPTLLPALQNLCYSWERLDIITPGNRQEKTLIIAEIAGEPKELSNLKALIQPAPTEDPRAIDNIIQFFRSQGLIAHRSNKTPQPGEYTWHIMVQNETWIFNKPIASIKSIPLPSKPRG